MGINLLLNAVALERGRMPDWSAGERAIEELDRTGYDGYMAYWDDSMVGSEPTEDELGEVREQLRADLSELRSAVENYYREATSFEFRGLIYYLTGGLSVGEVPTALYDCISRLHAAAVLEPAGFVPVSVDVGGLENRAEADG